MKTKIWLPLKFSLPGIIAFSIITFSGCYTTFQSSRASTIPEGYAATEAVEAEDRDTWEKENPDWETNESLENAWEENRYSASQIIIHNYYFGYRDYPRAFAVYYDPYYDPFYDIHISVIAPPVFVWYDPWVYDWYAPIWIPAYPVTGIFVGCLYPPPCWWAGYYLIDPVVFYFPVYPHRYWEHPYWYKPERERHFGRREWNRRQPPVYGDGNVRGRGRRTDTGLLPGTRTIVRSSPPPEETGRSTKPVVSGHTARRKIVREVNQPTRLRTPEQIRVTPEERKPATRTRVQSRNYGETRLIRRNGERPHVRKPSRVQRVPATAKRADKPRVDRREDHRRHSNAPDVRSARTNRSVTGKIFNAVVNRVIKKSEPSSSSRNRMDRSSRKSVDLRKESATSNQHKRTSWRSNESKSKERGSHYRNSSAKSKTNNHQSHRTRSHRLSRSRNR